MEIETVQSSLSPLTRLAVVGVLVAGAVIVLRSSDSEHRADMIRAMVEPIHPGR
ncbi:hypothetical protein [Micromonospora sp. NBC_00858]|uniref:hypothetical protein n=1 Tax=Micromonospora sp. NBC_00858 TaxID=2975979 RepID=UPI003864A93C|nr:hypothetical protein OG990_24250 [Micromonospora sp. NBC_00858]